METDAEYNRKAVAAHPQANFEPQHVTFVLRPTNAEPVRYTVTTRWGESRDGEYVETAVEKQLVVAIAQQAAALAITVEQSSLPVLRKPEPLPFDEVTLLLAEVYRKLVLATSPAGRVLGLLNHAEVVTNWGAVKGQFRAYEGDETIALLQQLVDTRVQDATALLASLRFDYFFGLFLKNVYQQEFTTSHTYTQQSSFPQFFSDVSVAFLETMTLVPTAGPQPHATLVFTGLVDEAHSNRAAVAHAIAARLGAAPVPADLHFDYEATCVLDKATGLPVSLDATVACGSRPRYQKEYTLTVRRI